MLHFFFAVECHPGLFHVFLRLNKMLLKERYIDIVVYLLGKIRVRAKCMRSVDFAKLMYMCCARGAGIFEGN